MLTTIVLVLVLLAVVVVAAWWFLDFDMPEIVIPVARYRRRSYLLVRHGTGLGDRPLAAADRRLRPVSLGRQSAAR